MQKTERLKRARALQACEVCRARKNRCNEEHPCAYCVDHDLECVYARRHRAKRRGSFPYTTRNFQPEASPSQQDKQPRIETRELQQPSEPSNHEGLSDDRLSVTGVHDFPCESLPINASHNQHSPSPNVLSPSLHLATAHSPSSNQQLQRRQSHSTNDVMDTNSHTRNLEFYGASSSVAFLRHVDTISGSQEPMTEKSERSLASLLHNTNFISSSTPKSSTLSGHGLSSNDRFHFRVARKFIEAYFSNIHYIQPIFDEEVFLSRCEDLWFEKPENQPLSFIALYYATLSLGSLVMVWDDREIYGEHRFGWSRKFFKEAVALVNQLDFETNLEMVQCYYLIGKVCQHELNPHVAYLYSGQATRTALAIGLNRFADGKASDPRSSTAAAKTWWAAYCLDIQTSFALGRPDSLGPDEYHTQYVPGAPISYEAPPNVLQIVPCMVELSRIMRRVSLRLYTRPYSVQESIVRAKELDAEMLCWLQGLPPHFQPGKSPPTSHQSSLMPKRSPAYIKKQSVVLMIRYYNLRMIVHGKFLTVSEAIDADTELQVRECQQKCIDFAGQAIDLMYDTFRNDNFFQTWWYNSTYTLFAVSILLTAVFHKLAKDRSVLDYLFQRIDRAIAVLEAMEECTVTRNATLIIKRTLTRAKKVSQGFTSEQQQSSNPGVSVVGSQPNSRWMEALPPSSAAGWDVLGGSVEDIQQEDVSQLDWVNTPFPIDDGQQALFWVEWAHHLDTLGA